MGIRFPHIIAYTAQTQNITSNQASNKTTTGSTTNIPAFVQAVSPGAALEAFGVELSFPNKVYVDDSVGLAVPGQFTFDGGTYEIKAGPIKRTGLSASLSYTMFLAEKVNR